jgi:hypothetical protein
VIEVVDGYKYLGMWISRSSHGRWTKNKSRLITKARQRLGLAWSMALRSGCLSVKSGIRIWQGLVRPVLEYGAEVWESEGDCKWQEAERVQLMMGKRILRCRSSTTDEVVRGELGWGTMRGRRMMLRIRYWGKVVSMGRDRLVRKVYEEGRKRHLRSKRVRNWCSYTHKIMSMVGLEESWQSNSVGEDWKEVVKQKVWEWEEAQWKEGMASKRKLRLYRRVKEELKLEEYLASENSEGRRQMTMFRGGSSYLRIETGRWEGHRGKPLPVEERVCKLCHDGVEDEEHVLMKCSLYDDLREGLKGERGLHIHNGLWGEGSRCTAWMEEYLLARGMEAERENIFGFVLQYLMRTFIILCVNS